MLKLFLVILFVYRSVEAQTRQLCPYEILAKERISKQKCEEYSMTMKKPLRWGRKPPCGWRNVSDCESVKIEENHRLKRLILVAGGIKAAPKEFPHMAAIGWTKEDGNVGYHCGGSLISDRFVLTAAHCLWYEDKRPDIVLLGDLDLSTDEDVASPLNFSIKRWIRHKDYNIQTNDIALIELATKVNFNRNFIRPACLQSDEHQFSENEKVKAVSWGLLRTFGKTSDSLMKVEIPIRNMSQCRHDLDDEDLSEESQICAGGEWGKDTCFGDSGGPIQLPLNDLKCVYNIIGVTSYGSHLCAHGSAAIYTKVSHFIDWIESKVWPAEYRAWKKKNQV